jgi:hypothetical protein
VTGVRHRRSQGQAAGQPAITPNIAAIATAVAAAMTRTATRIFIRSAAVLRIWAATAPRPLSCVPATVQRRHSRVPRSVARHHWRRILHPQRRSDLRPGLDGRASRARGSHVCLDAAGRNEGSSAGTSPRSGPMSPLSLRRFLRILPAGRAVHQRQGRTHRPRRPLRRPTRPRSSPANTTRTGKPTIAPPDPQSNPSSAKDISTNADWRRTIATPLTVLMVPSP